MKQKINKTMAVLSLILFTTLGVTGYSQETAALNSGIKLNQLSLKKDSKDQWLINIDVNQLQTISKREAIKYMLIHGTYNESVSIGANYKENDTKSKTKIGQYLIPAVNYESKLMISNAKFNINSSLAGSYIKDTNWRKSDPRVNISFTLLKITF